MAHMTPTQKAFVDGYISGNGSIAAGLAAQNRLALDQPVDAPSARSLYGAGRTANADADAAATARYIDVNGSVVEHGVLNYRQRMFAREYVIDRNATQAAIRAGYSQLSAGAIGAALSNDSRIAAYVNTLEREMAERTTMTAQNTLDALGHLSESDLRDIFHENGETKAPWELPTRAARAIKAFEVIPRHRVDENGTRVTDQVYKYTFWDKPAALNTMARYHGIVSDRPAEDTLASMEIETKREMRRQILRELAGIAKPTTGDAIVINPDGTEV